ncbi:hypothetical protein A2U01_0078232, partial [Trifolium medium]|nr:hypothetical protein [Trifolium medium]
KISGAVCGDRTHDHVVIVVTTDHQVRGEIKVFNVPLCVIHIGGTIALFLAMNTAVHLGVMKKGT